MLNYFRQALSVKSFCLKGGLASYFFFAALPQNQGTVSHWAEKGVAATYTAASWLTEPLCRAHQLYRQTLLVDTLYPSASTLEKAVRKGLLFLQSASHAFFSFFTTLPGIELRFVASTLQNKPFIYFKGEAEEKELTDPSFSLLSWNLCCVTGGYSITDGGVLPWDFRKDLLLSTIQAQDADVLCLYEIFDIQTALFLVKGLKNSYSHFYFHIGPSIIGLSSGLFVASKMAVRNPEFVPFPQEALYGRSKHCKKGFFTFDIEQRGKHLARIFSTHFQHSEVPDAPAAGELEARRHEMELILDRMEKLPQRVCILTGDLNLEDKEYHSSDWREIFTRGSVEGAGFTWGGDQFCASLVNKAPSSPANLDYTLAKKGVGVAITTSFVETGFDQAAFNLDAISDHKGLLSIITLTDSL